MQSKDRLCDLLIHKLKPGNVPWDNLTNVILDNVTTEVNQSTTSPDSDGDAGAVYYIVVVLLFYSTGIIVMIIKYSKTRSKEVEEEMALDIFFKGMPLGKSTREHDVTNTAIRAFHALTVVDYQHKNGILPRSVLETDV